MSVLVALWHVLHKRRPVSTLGYVVYVLHIFFEHRTQILSLGTRVPSVVSTLRSISRSFTGFALAPGKYLFTVVSKLKSSNPTYGSHSSIIRPARLLTLAMFLSCLPG